MFCFFVPLSELKQMARKEGLKSIFSVQSLNNFDNVLGSLLIGLLDARSKLLRCLFGTRQVFQRLETLYLHFRTPTLPSASACLSASGCSCDADATTAV